MSTMSGYELRRHLAADHGIEVAGLAFAGLKDRHDGEHFADRSRPAPDHDHDEDGLGHARGSSMAHPSHRPAEQVRHDEPGIPPG